MEETIEIYDQYYDKYQDSGYQKRINDYNDYWAEQEDLAWQED